MAHLKLYGSAAIFVFVTILKLLLPDATAQARQQVVTLIDMDMDYREMAVQVGALLSDEPVQQVMGLFKSEPVNVGQTSPLPTATVVPTTTLVPTPELTSAPSPTPTVQTETNVSKAVAAFHSAQAEYVDYPTPNTVCYDNLSIPFEFTAPVEGVTSSGFGYRVHPLEQQVRFHYGTDYAVDIGTAVGAFADGEVTMTGFEQGYGNFVEVTHADGWKTLYAHCSEVTVTWGQTVKKGETIALSGQTGVTTGPHLHFELSCNGYYTNPEFFF